MSPVGGAPSPATKHWAAEPPQEIGFRIQRQRRKTSPIRTEHLSGSHITFRESDGFESGLANVVDHSVVQRCLPPKMRATIRNGRPVKPGFVGVGFCYCGNPAADHGVVRDFAAAFVLIHRLDAGDGFESGFANVVDLSLIHI